MKVLKCFVSLNEYQFVTKVVARRMKTKNENKSLSTNIGVSIFILGFLVMVEGCVDVNNKGWVLPFAEPESVGVSSDGLREIDSRMQKFIDDGQMSGLLTLVAKDEKIIHLNTYGYRDVKLQKPMTKDTIFRIYSMTKPVTGVAVMVLVETGEIGLDDPVGKYLPEFRSMKVLENGRLVDAYPITIRHLLTHTAGLSYYHSPDEVGKMHKARGLSYYDAQVNKMTLAEYVQAIAELPLVSQPGTQWQYSVAMDVLGRVVEVVSGRTYSDFLQQKIFVPLGMNDTGFHVPPAKLDRFSVLYISNKDDQLVGIDRPETSTFKEPPSLHFGGGGLVSTASDYLKFCYMLLNGGLFESGRILQSQSVDLMMSNQLTEELGPHPLSSLMGDEGKTKGLGFGFTGYVLGNPSSGKWREFGWGGAATTDFWVDTEANMVGMIFTQLLSGEKYSSRKIMHDLTYESLVNINP